MSNATMRRLGVPMICGDRCSGHVTTKHLRIRFVDNPPDPSSNEYECERCGAYQHVTITARDRMCFSMGNPHARTHNEWVIACGGWHQNFVVADGYRRLWKFGFWCALAMGALLYFTK